MHANVLVRLAAAALYALAVLLMGHDVWTVFYRPDEWRYVFGADGFGWAYRTKANYVISGIGLLLWYLLGLALALPPARRWKFRFLAGHLALTFAYLACVRSGLP